MRVVNRTELTPLAFLERNAEVFADKPAVLHGDMAWTYAEFGTHAQQFARALRATGLEPGDRVAVLAPNIPMTLTAHFAVPLAGCVLVTINTRLAPLEVAYICDHAKVRLLIVDTGFEDLVGPVLADLATLRTVVAIDDVGRRSELPGAIAWPDFLAAGERGDDLPWAVDDEDGVISINYTSGTTGNPKGVIFSHRGAWINAFGEVITARHTADSVYLWTVPMFHCNGWCTTWAVTAVGGTHVCLREVRGDAIWRAIREQGVTHLNAAPTVLTMLVNDPAAMPVQRPLVVTTAGAPPSPTIIGQVEALGASVVHVYGLTETYGPYTVCEPQPAWADLPIDERAARMAQQGVAMVMADPIRVVDDAMRDVPRDGATIGEIVMRGNNVMVGYLDEPDATAEAFAGGWFHSGDLGVWHPNGYVEVLDREKDIIISGGENISSVQVEKAVVSHPDVMEVAVVGVPDERWGERPKAYVVPAPGATIDPDAIREHVRGQLAKFKVPDEVEVVDDLPRTSTGKIRKYELRQAAWADEERRVRG